MPRAPQVGTRSHTVRQDLAQALGSGPATAHDLSKAVGCSEREVLGHLVHLGKSLRARGARLVIRPAQCLDCGFEFTRRERPARPSRCARCRSTRLSLPEFSISPGETTR